MRFSLGGFWEGHPKIERVGLSLVIRKRLTIHVWGNVFGKNGTLVWDPETEDLAYYEGVHEGMKPNPLYRINLPGSAPNLRSLYLLESKRTPWYKWPVLVFSFVVLPVAIMAEAGKMISQNTALSSQLVPPSYPSPGVKPGRFVLKNDAAKPQISISHDSSWMK